MAMIDYYLCDLCGEKCFYDANVRWKSTNVGDIRALCTECAKEARIEVVRGKGRVRDIGTERGGHTYVLTERAKNKERIK
ncbi:MAG: hypothetical protein OEY97_07690 [Nitrospirota bacterium]|nr:hypothetical protein [Nitrospirota bacterium]